MTTTMPSGPAFQLLSSKGDLRELQIKSRSALRALDPRDDLRLQTEYYLELLIAQLLEADEGILSLRSFLQAVGETHPGPGYERACHLLIERGLVKFCPRPASINLNTPKSVRWINWLD